MVTKLLAFYGTWRVTIVFTTVHHWPISWATWIQSILTHIFSITSILIFLSRLFLLVLNSLFPSGFLKFTIRFSYLPCVLRAQLIPSLINIWWTLHYMELLILLFVLLSYIQIFPSASCSETRSTPALRVTGCVRMRFLNAVMSYEIC
jgi:hypothetical protein